MSKVMKAKVEKKEAEAEAQVEEKVPFVEDLVSDDEKKEEESRGTFQDSVSNLSK